MDELISQLGRQAPVAASVFVTLIYAFRWFATRIAEPLAARHVQHIDKAEEQMERQTETLNELKNCMTQMQRNQQEHIEICRGSSLDRGRKTG